MGTEIMVSNNTVLINNTSQVYTRDEMVNMLNLDTKRMLYSSIFCSEIILRIKCIITIFMLNIFHIRR